MPRLKGVARNAAARQTVARGLFSGNCEETMSTDITPTEVDGQFYVSATMDGQAMKPHGPFADANEAEAVAARFAGICRALHQPVAISIRSGQPAAERRG